MIVREWISELKVPMRKNLRKKWSNPISLQGFVEGKRIHKSNRDYDAYLAGKKRMTPLWILPPRSGKSHKDKWLLKPSILEDLKDERHS